MRSNSNEFFICKVAEEVMQDNGTAKMETRAYAVEALSWTEAEARITEYEHCHVSEYDIRDISRARFSEVFFSNKEIDDRYFLAKLAYVTLDERSGKEKRNSVYYLFQAGSLDTASKYVEEMERTTMRDFEKVELKDSGLCDVMEYGTAPEDK